MTTGTNLGRASNPLPAARPHNDCSAHGLSRHNHATAEVTRPTIVPIPSENEYYFFFKPAMASFISLKWTSGLPESVT
jgi:hypothetical protein